MKPHDKREALAKVGEAHALTIGGYGVHCDCGVYFAGFGQRSSVTAYGIRDETMTEHLLRAALAALSDSASVARIGLVPDETEAPDPGDETLPSDSEPLRAALEWAAVDAHVGWMLYESERGTSEHAKEFMDCAVEACAKRRAALAARLASKPAEPFTVNGVPVVRRDDLTPDSDPAHDFDGPDPFAEPAEQEIR